MNRPLCLHRVSLFPSLKDRSRQGHLAALAELEEREAVREELQAVKVWLEAANSVLVELEDCPNAEDLQEIQTQLIIQKAVLQRVTDGLRIKYSDLYTLVPAEINTPLKEVTDTMKNIDKKVEDTVEKSSPLQRLGAKMSEIKAGLGSVQDSLQQRSPSLWHSRVAALEVAVQETERPEELHILVERLGELQQLHSSTAKQAEQRTAFLSKEHDEMINSSNSWLTEAQSWLTAPCTYTTAKCLRSHVHALQMVLDDSEQIRMTLQGFVSMLTDISPVCDVTAQKKQLSEADGRVAAMQLSFVAPLSQMEHAAAEVEAIETEVKSMEKDVCEIRLLLSSPHTLPSPKEESLKVVRDRLGSMKRTVEEIQTCKPGLCLPEEAEETLSVFQRVEQLQQQLTQLDRMLLQQSKETGLPSTSTPVKICAPRPPAPPLPLERGSASSLVERYLEGAQENGTEQGRIQIVHVEEDALKKRGAALMTVAASSPEQRRGWGADLSRVPEVASGEEPAGGGEASGTVQQPNLPEPQPTELQTGQDDKDAVGFTPTSEAGSGHGPLSKPLGTVRTQTLPSSMVNTPSTVKLSNSPPPPQQRCVVS